MRPHLKKIQLLVPDSTLTSRQQHELIGFLALIDDRDLQAITGLFCENKKTINIFYENIVKKREALKKNSARAWKEIIDDELSMLKH